MDLAGSERYTKTGAEGSVAKEAMHINKSLSFLEQASSGLHAVQQAPLSHTNAESADPESHLGVHSGRERLSSS